MVPEKNPTTAKVEYRAVLEPSTALVFQLPPPPRPLTALNMPGQRKQTKATRTSWTCGLAYHGMESFPILRLLYIHPVGRTSGAIPSLTECEGELAPASSAVVGPFSDMMDVVACRVNLSCLSVGKKCCWANSDVGLGDNQ